QPSWRRRNAGTSNELRSKSRSMAASSAWGAFRGVSLPSAPAGSVGPAGGPAGEETGAALAETAIGWSTSGRLAIDSFGDVIGPIGAGTASARARGTSG